MSRSAAFAAPIKPQRQHIVFVIVAVTICRCCCRCCGGGGGSCLGTRPCRASGKHFSCALAVNRSRQGWGHSEQRPAFVRLVVLCTPYSAGIRLDGWGAWARAWGVPPALLASLGQRTSLDIGNTHPPQTAMYVKVKTW